MIPDAFLPSQNAMTWLVGTVSEYVAFGLGFGIVVWALGYCVYWFIDLMKGGTAL